VKASERLAMEIRAWYMEGTRIRRIAEDTGIHESTIANIVMNRSWVDDSYSPNGAKERHEKSRDKRPTQCLPRGRYKSRLIEKKKEHGIVLPETGGI